MNSQNSPAVVSTLSRTVPTEADEIARKIAKTLRKITESMGEQLGLGDIMVKTAEEVILLRIYRQEAAKKAAASVRSFLAANSAQCHPSDNAPPYEGKAKCAGL